MPIIEPLLLTAVRILTSERQRLNLDDALGLNCAGYADMLLTLTEA